MHVVRVLPLSVDWQCSQQCNFHLGQSHLPSQTLTRHNILDIRILSLNVHDVGMCTPCHLSIKQVKGREQITRVLGHLRQIN